MNQITFTEFSKIMKKTIKEQGINDTLIALAWNIVEAKQDIKKQQYDQIRKAMDWNKQRAALNLTKNNGSAGL